jgi:hypothetical protein
LPKSFERPKSVTRRENARTREQSKKESQKEVKGKKEGKKKRKEKQFVSKHTLDLATIRTTAQQVLWLQISVCNTIRMHVAHLGMNKEYNSITRKINKN